MGKCVYSLGSFCYRSQCAARTAARGTADGAAQQAASGAALRDHVDHYQAEGGRSAAVQEPDNCKLLQAYVQLIPHNLSHSLSLSVSLCAAAKEPDAERASAW